MKTVEHLMIKIWQPQKSSECVSDLSKITNVAYLSTKVNPTLMHVLSLNKVSLFLLALHVQYFFTFDLFCPLKFLSSLYLKGKSYEIK